MNDLIERLEKCAGPDRELDADIALAMGWTECPGDNWIGPHGQIAVPEYTASLDAALTLVPEGLEWQVSTRAPKPHAGRAYLHNNELHFRGAGCAPNPRYRGYENTAATPAIALCIAALRSRANEGERV